MALSERFVKLRELSKTMPGIGVMKMIDSAKVIFPDLSDSALKKYLMAAVQATDATAELYTSGQISYEAMMVLASGETSEPQLQDCLAREAVAKKWEAPELRKVKVILKATRGRLSIQDVISKAMAPLELPRPPAARGMAGKPMENAHVVQKKPVVSDLVDQVGRIALQLRTRIQEAQLALAEAPPEVDRGEAHREIFQKCYLLRHFVTEQVDVMNRDAQKYVQGPALILRQYMEEQLSFLDSRIQKYLDEIMRHVASPAEAELLKKEFAS